MNTWRIINADVREGLAQLEDESVQCVVTSPPYWGLRDYGVPGQLGLEKTPEDYVERMAEVFREIRRVLRKDGTLWLNMGDCYASSGGHADTACNDRRGQYRIGCRPEHTKRDFRTGAGAGLKPKNLIGMPWRLTFALQADGWWLRCDIIWSKPNPMPESVTDRPTKAHEYVFLMSKSARYYYDADAIRQPLAPKTFTTFGTKHHPQGNDALGKVKSDNWGTSLEERQPKRNADGSIAGANKRSVWEITTQPYPDAHFATFPEKLVEPCVKAGTSERGCCLKCGAGWERVVDHTRTPRGEPYQGKSQDVDRHDRTRRLQGAVAGARAAGGDHTNPFSAPITVDWRPTCKCKKAVRPAIVLDPFCGSGTAGAMAVQLGRSFIGIELNPEYCEMARKRVGASAPLFAKEIDHE